MEVLSSKIVSKLGVHPASMTIETLQGKPVLAIQMHRAPSPVLLSGHFWRRVGNSSREVPAEELTRFLLERTGQTWDMVACATGLDVLDAETVEDFKVLAQPRLPALRPSDNIATILNNLQLLDNEGRLFRAAVLLFGKDQQTQRLSPTAFVQIGRFKSGAEILDEKTMTGNLFQQLNAVMQQFRVYLQARYEFPSAMGEGTGIEALQRREVWDYPLEALREAVANALLHRDYASAGRVMIRVYDDRVLITSPGGLPKGVSIDDLSRDPHPSKLRNPLLAEAFYFASLVERWGSGTTRMASACAAQGLPAPDFAQISGELHVTFHKDAFNDERLQRMELSERQRQAVRHAREKGSISNAEYRALMGLSDRTASRDLEALVDKDIMTRTSTGRLTRYRLNQSKPAKPAINPP